jgi:hypothetical protein
MKRGKFLLLLPGVHLVLSCALGTQPPLISRGLPREDRYAFATQNGYDVPPEIRNAFISGCLVKGMRRDFAFQVYGYPDRNSEIGEGWEWHDRNGNLITGVLFKGDKVDSIYGDPRGGSPAGAGCP